MPQLGIPDIDWLKQLGQGFFGKVFLVKDRALGVKRALKIVDPGSIREPSEFHREPQMLQELQHPNIVRVYSAGRTDKDEPYIVMHYHPRGSAADLMRTGPLPLSQALRFSIDVCWALEFAHNRNFLHRDIKPSNILVTQRGAGKLADFGLATKIEGASGDASPTGYTTHLAPEVLLDDVTNRLTDIYAVGVTLYRMVNGDDYLNGGAAPTDLTDIIAGSFPNRRRYRAFVPREVRRVVNKAMHVDPDLRYRSASDLRQALEQLNVACDWSEDISADGFTWIGIAGEWTFMAELRRNRRYNFTMTRRRQGKAPRRLAADCKSGMSKADAQRHSHKVLSRITATGR